ncbi:MAG: xanthine dehydrogenase family protein molybdopterin-binding subunit [Pseudomonadales bacterium]|nr:xanthine dehydrogenase family protein molybdopterin-binding subunit [Pseudomonadales bacterium]
MKTTMNRRGFLKASALATGGMMLEFSLPLSAIGEELGTLVGSGELNAYVKIASDGTITIYSANPEMGQGIKTALPMIIAEEMGARWEDVVVLQSPVDDSKYGRQGAGGSTTIPRSFDLMRQVGASAREMLIGAAAESMEVPRGELEAKDSKVTSTSGHSLTFGQLASLAVKQPIPDPDTLKFKDPEDYTIIGTSVSGVDNLVIATGMSRFGIDTSVPDMLYAVYHKCPAIGGKAVSFNEAEIKKLPGIVDAFIIDGNGDVNQLLSGVAIVGRDTWSVFAAKDALKVKWDESAASKDDWDEIVRTGERLQDKGGGNVIYRAGDVDLALRRHTDRTIEADYSYPFVAHLCMEPMNTTAHYKKGSASTGDEIEAWVPTQAAYRIPSVMNDVFGVSEKNVTIHQTRLGGGFGRRGSAEFVCEAVAISKRAGKPVKLTWTRPDDMQHDFYRVAGFQHVKGSLDKQGRLVAWDQHFIGMTRNGEGPSGSRFSPSEFPLLNLPNTRGTMSTFDIGTPCGPWRAPGSNTHAFVVQSFIHELATLAGRDHLEFLLEIMGERRWLEPGNIRALNTGRAIDVIKLVAEKAGWGRDMPEGSGLGLAFHFSHAAHVAEVAEVSVDTQKRLRVHKLWAVADVGPIINLSGATSQVQGSIIDGLSTMAGQKITMSGGRIEQHNLDDYNVMRIAQAPDVEVHFIQSDNRPTGIGEPGLPPLAPAVGNAIFAATGVRVRTMPLTDLGYRLV